MHEAGSHTHRGQALGPMPEPISGATWPEGLLQVVCGEGGRSRGLLADMGHER